jgi:hypothetical protein
VHYSHFVAMQLSTTYPMILLKSFIQNQRRRFTLAEIDRVPFRRYHVRFVAVAGAGFLAGSYDFAINFAVQMIGMAF